MNDAFDIKPKNIQTLDIKPTNSQVLDIKPTMGNFSSNPISEQFITVQRTLGRGMYMGIPILTYPEDIVVTDQVYI